MSKDKERNGSTKGTDQRKTRNNERNERNGSTKDTKETKATNQRKKGINERNERDESGRREFCVHDDALGALGRHETIRVGRMILVMIRMSFIDFHNDFCIWFSPDCWAKRNGEWLMIFYGSNIRVDPVYLIVIFPPLFLVFMEDKKGCEHVFTPKIPEI